MALDQTTYQRLLDDADIYKLEGTQNALAGQRIDLDEARRAIMMRKQAEDRALQRANLGPATPEQVSTGFAPDIPGMTPEQLRPDTRQQVNEYGQNLLQKAQQAIPSPYSPDYRQQLLEKQYPQIQQQMDQKQNEMIAKDPRSQETKGQEQFKTVMRQPQIPPAANYGQLLADQQHESWLEKKWSDQIKVADSQSNRYLQLAKTFRDADNPKRADELVELAAATYDRYSDNPRAKEQAEAIRAAELGIAPEKATKYDGKVVKTTREINGKAYDIFSVFENGNLREVDRAPRKETVANGGASTRSYSAGVGEQGQYVVRKANGSLWQPDGHGGQMPYVGTNVYPMKEGLALSAPGGKPVTETGDTPAVTAATGMGLSKSIQKQVQNIGAMGAFVKKMDLQTDRIKEIGDEIKSSDVRLFNTPINWYQGRIVGDVSRSKFKMYLAELESEAGKLATGNSQSISNLPVSTQEKWAKIHDGSLSIKELLDLLDETKKSGKMNLEAAESQLAETKIKLNTLGGGRPKPPMSKKEFIFNLKKSKAGDHDMIKQAVSLYGKEEAEKMLANAWGVHK
jgi:hypothetical protein